MIRSIFFFLMMILIAAGCSPREPVPREFPDEDEMAEILADLYFSESVLDNRRYKIGSEKVEDVAPGYYKNVLKSYNLTTIEFDTIRKWYVAHPHHYQDVCDKVVVLLSQREAELNKQIKAEEEAADSVPELLDLWELDRKLQVNVNDTSDRCLPFSFMADSIQQGQIRLSAFYRYLRPDMSKDAKTTMITLYADSTSDTISVPLIKTFEKKPVSLIADIDTAPPVIEVSGFLFDHDTAVTSAVEFSEIRLEHLESEEPREDNFLLKKELNVR